MAPGPSPTMCILRMLWPCIPGKKLTQKDNADSGVQFITLVGQRQGLQPVFVKTLYTLSVCAQTHLPKFPETSLNKGKEKYNKS